MKTQSRAIASLLQWFFHMGVTQFDLAIQRRGANGVPRQFLAPRFTGAESLEMARLESRLPWLRAENAAGNDIYFRPSRRIAWPMVFLDDLPPRIATKIAVKYRAAVIETSPGSCHLWLGTALPLAEAERTRVQQDLVTRLQGAADPGSVSGDHWGRLPGFRNHKPHRNCWVNLHTTSKAPPYLPSPTTPALTNTVLTSPRPFPRSEDGPDMSRLEWGWVRGCLESGVPSHWVLLQLIRRARRRRGENDAIRYARYTVQKACRLLGLPGPYGGYA
ncbi:MAG: hypothetical protein GY807_04960 [Gammaproteobacteria bacterium]|nr:hypothetical protein [Gammaproteobacteria bacterium]